VLAVHGESPHKWWNVTPIFSFRDETVTNKGDTRVIFDPDECLKIDEGRTDP